MGYGFDLAFSISLQMNSWKEARQEEKQGQIKLIHFTVQPGTPDILDLIVNTETFTWQLAKVQLEG